MVYKVVLAFESFGKAEVPSEIEIQEGVRKRQEIFRANNALDRLDARYLSAPLFVYLLTIGNNQMIIGFATMAGDVSMRVGISVTDKDFIEKVIRWYDYYLLPNTRVMHEISKAE